jgi:hypothetical protein
MRLILRSGIQTTDLVTPTLVRITTDAMPTLVGIYDLRLSGNTTTFGLPPSGLGFRALPC